MTSRNRSFSRPLSKTSVQAWSFLRDLIAQGHAIRRVGQRYLQRFQRHRLYAVELSAHLPLHGRHLQLYAAPRASLVVQPQPDPHRLRVGNVLGRVAGQVEVIPGLNQRLVEAVDDLLGPCAERRVLG